MTTLTYESDITATATIDGVRFGVTYAGMRWSPDDNGYRAAYHWQVDLPGNVVGATDLSGPTSGHPSPREMLSTLCSFLGAAAEAYGYDMRNGPDSSENGDLFPPEVTEWAYQHEDDITMLALELDEEDKS